MRVLNCGEDLVGYVMITGGEMFHISGIFLPGPDFRPYEGVLMRAYGAFVGDASDWIDRLEEVNELGFTIADSQRGSTRQIRDFQLHEVEGLKNGDGVRVEFKFYSR